jgi:hypothetical protein
MVASSGDARMRSVATQKKPLFSRQSIGELLQRVNCRTKGTCDTKAAFYQLELDEESKISDNYEINEDYEISEDCEYTNKNFY